MKARPILFSGAMVRANLADIKTQTRRVVKRADEWHPDTRSAKVISLGADGVGAMPFDEFGRMLGGAVRCPYGQPGDRLWVREAFRLLDVFDGDSPNTVADRCLNAGYLKPWAPTHYEADGWRNNWQHVGTPPYESGAPTAGKLRPGIHMPQWASRITLEITGIRVERLHVISASDALAEGVSEDLIKSMICDKAAQIETRPEYWINEDVASESWCRDCGEKRIQELLKDDPKGEYHLSGGYRSENDSQTFCNGCGARLDNSFTDYCCEEELEHFQSHGFDIKSTDDCYSLYEVLSASLWSGGKNSAALHRLVYRILWESINGPGSWAANPWVWVIEFRRTPHG